VTQLKKIKVLIVDDSIFMQKYIASVLEKEESIEIVGQAGDPYEARDMIVELLPDVITLDIHMPKMDGIAFLEKLMPQYPLPVVVVSAVTSRVFDAMNAGAVDFINKGLAKDPKSKSTFESELVIKIKIASIAKVGQHKHKRVVKESGIKRIADQCHGDCLIAIGASTGGTEAIFNIISALGNDLPGIVVVQHMPPVFTGLYAERLNNSCAMEVKEAEDGDLIQPGRALIAPGGYQLSVYKTKGEMRVRVKAGPKVSGHCPSVDFMFDSVAKLDKVKTLGIILTGMGSDGAKGMLAMKQNGAFTIGQNQETCVVYGMPAVAYNIGAVDVQLPLVDMPSRVYSWYHSKIEK